MSVINSMLRDLDRRHAPLPVKAHVQPASAQNHRTRPRSAVALCALIIVVIWSWNHRTKQTMNSNISAPVTTPAIVQPEKPEIEAKSTPLNSDTKLSVTPPQSPNPELAIAPELAAPLMKIDKPAAHTTISKEAEPLDKQEATIAAAKIPEVNSEPQQPASVVKQERKSPEDLNSERYQLARAALAQHQPQRAYELLRDNPPSLANATDYHAVLAAVEQQLRHYTDATMRYQQLLSLDQNQASWWLGLALSLEGEQRSADALAAYQRATALNSLPDAARQYVAARMTALGPTTSQIVKAEH